VPETLDDDRNDLPEWGRRFAREVHDVSNARNYATQGEDHDMVLKHGQWQRAVQSYLATISFVDDHVGRLLDALDRSEHADTTLVVLWGDHGWHLGEKQHWRKHALWETTTRTTLIVATPEGLGRGQQSERLVSLIDLYPHPTRTLWRAGTRRARWPESGAAVARPSAGLAPARADDLRFPKPRGAHGAVALHRVGGGGEGVELYDHYGDPMEFNNLAIDPDPEAKAVIARLQPWLRAKASGKIPPTPFNQPRL